MKMENDSNPTISHAKFSASWGIVPSMIYSSTWVERYYVRRMHSFHAGLQTPGTTHSLILYFKVTGSHYDGDKTFFFTGEGSNWISALKDLKARLKKAGL